MRAASKDLPSWRSTVAHVFRQRSASRMSAVITMLLEMAKWHVFVIPAKAGIATVSRDRARSRLALG
jgi:hypothetical protein